MDNKDTVKTFYNADNYFLVDTINGKLKASNINIKGLRKEIAPIIGHKSYCAISKKRVINPKTEEEEYVSVESLAYLKSSEYTYQDDLDIINYEIAKLLGIKAMPAFHLLTKEKLRGSILISSLTKEDNLLSVDTLAKQMVSIIKEREDTIPSWLTDYVHLPATTITSPLVDSKLIKLVIDFPLNVISYTFNLDAKELYKIKNDYINMLLFQFMTNQCRLGLNTYSIISETNPKAVFLCPIYNYNNSLDLPTVFCLNNKHIDSEALINTLFSAYYPFFKDITRGLSENVSAYQKSMELIIDNNTASNNAKIIKANIFKRIDVITSLEEEMRLVKGESRIDMALTQTSINLNAVNRNQEVRNKYEEIDEYFKTSPEPEKEVEENVAKEKEMVKISVEEEKDPNKGHLNGFILAIIIIILILMISFGVYYYIINFLD